MIIDSNVDRHTYCSVKSQFGITWNLLLGNIIVKEDFKGGFEITVRENSSFWVNEII